MFNMQHILYTINERMDGSVVVGTYYANKSDAYNFRLYFAGKFSRIVHGYLL